MLLEDHPDLKHCVTEVAFALADVSSFMKFMHLVEALAIQADEGSEAANELLHIVTKFSALVQYSQNPPQQRKTKKKPKK